MKRTSENLIFNEIYTIAQQATSFNELKTGLENREVDVLSKNFPYVSVAGQFAIEGEHEKVEWLRELEADPGRIIKGYAYAGNDERVQFYRTHYTDADNWIVWGYALAGNAQRVETHSREHKVQYFYIGIGYAAGGHHKLVKDCYKQGRIFAGNIGQAYAEEGYHKEVEYYRERGASPHSIAEGYARGGYHEKVEFYRTYYGASLGQIYNGYQIAHNYEKIGEYQLRILLDKHINPHEYQINALCETKVVLQKGFFSHNQKSCNQENKAVNALLLALNGERVDLIPHLPALQNGDLGEKLQGYVTHNRANALVGKDVQNVSEFICALQDKIDEKHNYGYSAKKSR